MQLKLVEENESIFFYLKKNCIFLILLFSEIMSLLSSSEISNLTDAGLSDVSVWKNRKLSQ
jgi:hypothetical protein